MLRPVSKEEIKIIKDIIYGELRLKDVDLTSDLLALDVPGGSHIDIFKPPPSVRRFLILNRSTGITPYSLGLYIGFTSRRGGFVPSLPLAHELAPYCVSGNLSRCVYLPPGLEAKFLYGKKIILKDNIDSGLVLVLNTLREALGWAVVESLNNKYGERKRLLRPVRDLGWYLRRGG